MVAPVQSLQDLVCAARSEMEHLEAQAKAARQDLSRIAARANDLSAQIRASLTAQAPAEVDRDLAGRVCAQLGYDYKKLTHRLRTNEAVRQRAAVWSVLREDFGWSLERIGAAFGRDHGTVMNALAKHHPSRS